MVFPVVKIHHNYRMLKPLFCGQKDDDLPHPRAPKVCSESVLGSQHLDPWEAAWTSQSPDRKHSSTGSDPHSDYQRTQYLAEYSAHTAAAVQLWNKIHATSNTKYTTEKAKPKKWASCKSSLVEIQNANRCNTHSSFHSAQQKVILKTVMARKVVFSPYAST